MNSTRCLLQLFGMNRDALQGLLLALMSCAQKNGNFK
jgi:hypothetical protein